LRRINREAARTRDSSGRDHPDAAVPIASPRGEPTDEKTNAPAAPINRTDRPRIARDVALFVLDDEGVFFSESRRELSLFNTPATLVWCLLEEGQTVSEITQAYRDAFGLEEQEASRHVGTILQRWFGLGYITEPASLPGDEVPLTTALAQVLTNARLRSLFRQSPSGVAEALRVSREELDTFIALDPDELDAQAEDVARHRSASMGRGTASGGTALERDGVPDADTRDSSSASSEEAANPGAAARPGRRYRLLTTTFEIRVSSDDEARGAPEHSSALGDRIHDALAHLECLDGSAPDVELELRPSSAGGWTIFDEDLPVAPCRGTEDVVPAMKLLLRETAVNRHPFLVSVHAGVVSFGDGCVLLPASAGSGKTTLTAALIRSGATYFSDEIALLEEGTLAVRPVPLALTIKDGSVAPLRALYPEIDTLTPHVREDYVRVRYLSPPAESLPADDTPQPVRWIVFPRYTEGAGTELRPLTRPAALRRLLDESFLPLEQLDRRKVESLVQWMRTVECFELPLSSLDEAVPILRELMVGRGCA